MTMADRPGTKSSQGEIVIVGGGLAGLFCALKLAPHPVTVLAAAPIGKGASSAWAQAGIAASVSSGDSTEKHLADTVEAGAGIVDVDIASTMVAEGPQRVFDLLSYGVPFDRDPSGKLLAAREAAHSERRVVGVRGDMAGKAIMDALVAAVRKTPSIRVVECFVAEELLVSQGQVSGVLACHTARRARIRLNADAVALCTGGIGHLYNVTTNPAQSGGDGIGMAARAGARIADPEFVQFHPTAIDVGRDPAPLATEALRGDGAILVNSKNHRFMVDLHKDAELAPRDIVARGIFAEIKADRGAFLDCTKAIGSHFQQKFPTVFAHCAQAGIDPVHQPIPVTPAAHYHMGGIHTGVDGRTSVGGLWAAGEVASTGVHGANRLASNSLLEAVVFAARIAEEMKHRQPPAQHSRWTDPVDEPGAPDDEQLPSQMNRLRRLMGMCAGVIREEKDLRKAARSILEMKKDCSSLSFLNSLTAAALVIAGALQRTESRGGHFRIDYPQPDLQWQKRTYMTLQQTELLLRDAAERTIA